jgi:DsbC/DsbD-like thiol-disulfide interchange protein
MRKWLSGLTGALVSAAAVAAVFAAVRPTAHAGGKSDEEVELSVAAGKLDGAGKQTITLTMVINKGWHIYANPVGNDDLDSAATLIKVSGKVKPKAVKVDYPAGKEADDKAIGKYRYYENKVEIPISVQRAAGDTGPLELSVRFMACSKNGVCKLPATVKLTAK